MKCVRLVLAGLAAAMILLGDCAESEARCRLLGGRHRRCCASDRCPPTRATWVCPTQQTPYSAGQSGGVTYYMFYAHVYDANHIPPCWGMPQPAYLPDGSPTGCTQGAPCWNPSRLHAAAPTNLADYGHNMSQMQLERFGTPTMSYNVNFGTPMSPERRNIDFYEIPIAGHAEPLLIGLENPYAADYAVAPRHVQGKWNQHTNKARTVKFGSDLYYVLFRN